MTNLLRSIILMCSLLSVCHVYAQAYIGISIIDMDYQQSNILRAIMSDDDPSFTGLTYVYGDDSSAQRAYLIRAEGDVSSTTLNNNTRPDRETSFDYSIQAFNIKLGYSFNSWVSLEFRLGAGSSPAILKDYTEKIKKTKLLLLSGDSVGEDFANQLNSLFADELAITDQFRPFDNVTREEPLSCSDPTLDCKEVRDSVSIVETESKDSLLRTELFTGAYLRLGGDFNAGLVSPYIILGHTHAKYAVNADQGTGGGTVDSFSYGAGLNVDLTEKMYFNVEYLDLVDKGTIQVKSWSAGLEYKF